MSTTEYFLNFNQIGKIKLIVYSGPPSSVSNAPSSVSNAPHLSYSDLKKSGLIYFFQMPKSKDCHFYA